MAAKTGEKKKRAIHKDALVCFRKSIMYIMLYSISVIYISLLKRHRQIKKDLKLGNLKVKTSRVHVLLFTSLLVQHHHGVDAGLFALKDKRESHKFRTTEKFTDRSII